MILKRLKNLWELSAYRVSDTNGSLNTGEKLLKKSFPTVERRLATIIKEPTNYFDDGEVVERVS